MTQPVNFAKLMQDAKGQLDILPDGVYDMECVDAQATTASTGSPMIKCKFRVASGPYVKRAVTTNFVLSTDNPMALAIFFRNMEAMGLTEDFFVAEPSMNQVAANLVNRRVQANVGHKTWQGVDRNEIRGVTSPVGGGGPVAPGVVTGVATPGGPTAPGASPMPGSVPSPAQPTPTPASTPATPTSNIPMPSPASAPKSSNSSAPPLPL